MFVPDGTSLHALDQATGRARWTVETGPLAIAPAWRAGWLLTAGQDGTVSGWRASDGTRIWQQGLGSPASAALAVDGDRLILPLADKRLVELGVSDGAMVWSTRLDGAGGAPLAAAGHVYVGASDYTFFSINEEDGAIEWRHRLIRSTVVGHPVLDDRHIWVATLDNRVEALRRGNGEIEWMQTLPARPVEQLVIDGGEVIVPLSSGELAMFSQRDGKPVPSPTAPPNPPAGGSPPGAPVPPAAAAAPASVVAAIRQLLLPGTRLVPPLVKAGSDDEPQLLRVTLGSDDVLTVSSFQREKKPATAPEKPVSTSPNVSRAFPRAAPASRPPRKSGGTASDRRRARPDPCTRT